jgi:hypothetical protein
LSLEYDIARVGAAFAIDASFVSAAPHGSGHINDTFAATYAFTDGPRRFIHQRINHLIFKDPAALMANVAAVTRHVAAKLAAAGEHDQGRRVLELVSTRAGDDFLHDSDGSFWRTYVFIEGTRSHDMAEDPSVAFEAARAFGAFTAALDDYAGSELTATIPHFHDTPRRYGAFEAAVVMDRAGRAASVRDEIAFARSRGSLADGILRLQREGAVRQRITHNDTKVNNVLIDDVTGEGLCVIDLDTVMPGLALFDFGDMVRTAAATAREDETDLSLVDVDPKLFEALVDGYLSSAASILTSGEMAHLVLAAQVMTYQQALRFLTDHLDGDRYFRIHKDGHNLDRARTQMALLRRLEERRPDLERIVAKAGAG